VPGPVTLSLAYATAIHQSDSTVVHVDPLAGRIAGIQDSAIDANLPGGIDYRAEQRLFLAMSRRLAEDLVQAAVAAGLDQLIILDAGLLTTAYRRPYPHTLRLFEADGADTQRWKRRRLAGAGIEVPATLSFAPVENRHGLAAALAAAGYDTTADTLVIWLSTSVFLDEAELDATLAWLGGHTGRLEVVADYLQPLETLTPDTQVVMRSISAMLDRIGSPLRSFFAPAELATRLRAAGCPDVVDFAWADLAARYLPALTGIDDPLGAHVVHAVRAHRR
jgi:methyltransferase (TIGR00027 family)